MIKLQVCLCHVLTHVDLHSKHPDLLHFPAKPSFTHKACRSRTRAAQPSSEGPTQKKEKREMTSRFVIPTTLSPVQLCAPPLSSSTPQIAGSGAGSPTISSFLSDQQVWLQMFDPD